MIIAAVAGEFVAYKNSNALLSLPFQGFCTELERAPHN
jgi:hypothetical protein